jgi:exodeoxyribonuclease VII small subunit
MAERRDRSEPGDRDEPGHSDGMGDAADMSDLGALDALGDLDPASLGFEEAYRLLEATVAALEGDGRSLEECLALYERGAALAARCSELLANAELRVRQVDGDGRDVGPVAL